MSPSPGAGRLPALLALLPLAFLALPSGFELARDPEPLGAATGWIWLLGFPALALSLGSSILVRPLVALAWLLPLAAFLARSGPDSFERGRATLGFASAVAVWFAAAQWHRDGRRTFLAGLVVTSIAFTSVALLRGADAAWGGTLGNSGTLSQAALPGALVGFAWLLSEGGWRRGLGGLAAVLFAAHAALTPVLAAVVATSGVLAVVAVRRRDLRPLGAAALVAATVALPLGSGGAPSSDGAKTGGVDVRLELWRAAPSFWLEAPVLGVGPGQFRASFPPHRRGEEIEATTHGRELWEETEVEHVHNDYLHAALEYGAIGALGWWFLLGFVVLRALRAAGSDDAPTQATALASLGLLIAGLFHSPLFHSPVASWSAWALFGFLSSANGAELERRAVVLRLAPLVVLALLLPSAWDLVRHGAGLARAMEADGVVDGANAAVEAAPDSPLALSLRARARAAAGDRDGAVEDWRTVLEHRPHSLEALQQLGFFAATTGEPDGAAELWYRALELDPGHPRLIRNLARLELDRGRADVALELLMEFEGPNRIEPEFAFELGARELFAGRLGPGLALVSLGRTDPARAPIEGGNPLQLAQELQAEADRLTDLGQHEIADALRFTAHCEWARDHATRSDWRGVSASLRQALRLVRARGHESARVGTARVQAELAAALWRRDRRDEAREVASEIDASLLKANDLADFAREPLAQLGIVSGE